MQELKMLHRAGVLEAKYSYININGKTSSFSQFVLKELRKFIKADKKNQTVNPRWKHLHKIFEFYETDGFSERMKAVKELLATIEHEKNKTGIKSIASPEQADILTLKGIGSSLAKYLGKLGIYKVIDLLTFYPKRHLDYSNRNLIKELNEGEDVTIMGRIKRVNVFRSPKRPITIMDILISDGTGVINLKKFCGQNQFVIENFKKQYYEGIDVMVSGRVGFDSYSNSLTLNNYSISAIDGEFENTNLNTGRIVPVYNLTESLDIKKLRKIIYETLELFSPVLKDPFEADFREEHKLIDKQTAIKEIHFPSSRKSLDEARYRLIFEELFFMQLNLALIRKERKRTLNSKQIKIKDGGIVENFMESLPFKLTKGQHGAMEEILMDMNSEEAMQRLLQGDVGCGKTVVACFALIAAVENGYQAAIMAPTEVLAEQHYRSFSKWLTPLGLKVGLFLGKHGVKLRREMNADLKNGQINVAIGTHALIQESVEFKNLGVAVVDEQHRFGVKQRHELAKKGNNPHMLSMTATPIPRTLALCTHGDLDISSIHEMPAGRKKIETFSITSRERRKAHELILREVDKGNQAYIVFPLIEESETLSAKAATKEAEKLAKGAFKNIRVSLMHGKMTPKEKDAVMEEFRAKKTDVMVSTTVIEVGVDVPDATVMMIENAERFGLSQLHQLRGRVGRSDKQSYCILSAESRSSETQERMQVMTSTTDGFVIAEADLRLRGAGDITGIRQSGMSAMTLADIIEHTNILELARAAAFKCVENDNIKSLKDYMQTTLNITNEVIYC